jgi:hypothetical protein
MKELDKRQIVGLIAVGLSTVITCFWAFWGIIENLHGKRLAKLRLKPTRV